MQERSTSALREAQCLTKDISGYANLLVNFKYVYIFGNSLYELTFQKHQGHHYTCTCCDILVPLSNLCFLYCTIHIHFLYYRKSSTFYKLFFLQYKNSINYLICNFFVVQKFLQFHKFLFFSTGGHFYPGKLREFEKLSKSRGNLNSDRKNLENSGKT